MSGGEQQMLAVAHGRLLDEPTTGLAPIIAAVAFEAFGELKKQGDAPDRPGNGAARSVRGRPGLRARERSSPTERDLGGAEQNQEELRRAYLGVA